MPKHQSSALYCALANTILPLLIIFFIFGAVTLAHPPARNVFTALLFLILIFGAFCLWSPTRVDNINSVPATNTVKSERAVSELTPDTSVVAAPAPEPTPTPFVEADEMKAQTKNAKKAAALRDQQETVQHAKTSKPQRNSETASKDVHKPILHNL